MTQKQKMLLKATAIHRYLMGVSSSLDDMIMIRPDEFELLTTDQELYEGIASIQNRSEIQVNRLVKLLEVIRVDSSEQQGTPRSILTPQRAQDIVQEVKGDTNE